MPEYGEPLTEREKDILRLVATGVTNLEVAYRLSISVNTVKVHLRNVFTKLGAESRTEATMIAVREGWLDVEEDHGEAPEGAGGATTAVQPQVPPTAPEPPLPWRKRAALIAAMLLVVAGVTVTWPRSTPQAGDRPNLPLVPPPEQTPVAGQTPESSWRERAQMPTRRAYMALAAVEGHILAIGGVTPEGVTTAMEIYDPEDDIWTRGSDKPTPVVYVSAAIIGTDVYVPGGCDGGGRPTAVVEVYDVLSDSWREASPLPAPRCAYALAALDENLYLFGGMDGEQYVATVYVYDPQANTWTEGKPMNTKRAFAAAAPLEDRLYVVGGYDGERELTTCAAYDPAAEVWEECTSLAVGRGEVGLVALGGQLYAIGGGGWTSYLGFNERYNPPDDVWSPIETPLVGEWRGPGVAVLNNTIHAIGGWSGGYLSLNQAYEPFPFRYFIPASPQQ
jgi:DNA-binding CsgD family transcriptional regulator